ncbi:hypothetical protein [Nocardioides bizhenqiangii]|uniref:Uncharacterized protein n=1 Tax=Nocardioides bizhenqiangii TaxID=3095076 RepID=A0ABZ0ZPS4_9ACTN|nr:hypothetical protein [Nocardioides sp. HM61]WQQ26307.1 hypothetical protein SHK19_20395 [Nocardioides sp. HM61]
MRPPPRPLVAVALLVLAVTTVLAILGALETGVSTDEPIHVMRLRNFFDTGWYALDWDYSGAGPGGEGTNTYVYAPVTMLLLHGWSVLWGVEGWHEVATTSHAYDVRHLGVVVIALAGLAAVAAVGRVVLGSWRWGVVAAAVLAATPLWTGHAMFNVKDVPVATGHTLVTLALVLHVRENPTRPSVRVARSGCLVAGLILTLGTRPGMWAGIGVVLAVSILAVLLVSATRRTAAVTLAELLLACGAAAGALVAIYPSLFGSPLRALPRTSEASSSFRDGRTSDRFYVLRHLVEDLPTLLTVFALTGTVVAIAALLRRGRPDRVTAARLALVGAQAFTLLVVAVALGSDLYHGLRQLLFAIPALAVLAAYGMAWWSERARVRPGLLVVAAGAALVLPTVDQVTLQPYQTTYVNLATDVLSGSRAADERPGGDYWRVSIPELVARSALDRQLLCKATVDEATDLAHPFANGGLAFSTVRNTDCREEANGPLAPEGLPVVRQLPAEEFDAVFIGPLPSNCTPLDEVTRWRHGFEIVLSTIGRCTVHPTALPASGVRVSDTAPSTTFPSDLWRYAIDGWVQWPDRQDLTAPVPVAEVALRPSRRACAHGCRLVIEGTAPDDLVARVDGTKVPLTHDGPGTVTLPLGSARAARPVWVTFSRRSGETLGMTLSALSLAPNLKQSTTKGQE